MKPVRLALLAVAPIHYHVPTFRLLERDPRVDFTALFCSDVGLRPAELGFGTPVAWGNDLLSGYRSAFLRHAQTNRANAGFFSLHDADVVPKLMRGRFDVLWLHGYNYLTHQLAVAAQRARRGRVMFREEQTLIHPRALGKTVVKEIALRLMLRKALALYIGTESRRWFEHYGAREDQLFFAPYTVDNDSFQSAAAELRPRREEQRRSFGIPDDAGPVLMTAARLVPNKQPDLVLEAFARVRQGRPCALLVVGGGSLEERLRRRVAERSIPDVYFAGFLDQTRIARAYACADVFTLFSGAQETWGVVVNEAMNFSLPILVSDKVGCGRDLVSSGRNGWVVSADDVNALAARLEALLDDADLRARFGAESLAIIRDWGPERTAEGVVSAALAAADLSGAPR